MFFWANAADEGRERPGLFPQNNISPPYSVLDLLSASDIDWMRVAARALEVPRELRHRDAVRDHTPLFLAIQRDAPPFVIETFLRIYPGAASHVQRLGLTPLHLAIARGSPVDCVRHILNAWPEAATKKMNDGCVPLHFVRDVDTARLLIQVCPRALHVTNNASYLPLHRVAYAGYASAELVQLLVDAEETFLDTNRQLSATTFHGVTPFVAACEMAVRDIREAKPVCPLKWKKLQILAQAAYNSNHKQQKQSRQSTLQQCSPKDNTDQSLTAAKSNNFCLLHALLQMDTPTYEYDLIRYTLQRQPEQRTRLDDLGRSALTIAASRPETSTEILNLMLDDPVIRCLAGKTFYGRWPLHDAAASGRSFDAGLKALWKAAPQALTIPDRKTSLYPFLLAALGPDQDRAGQKLNTIFCLLRETPWLTPRTTGKRNEACLYGTLTKETICLILLWCVLPLCAALLVGAFADELASALGGEG